MRAASFCIENKITPSSTTKVAAPNGTRILAAPAPGGDVFNMSRYLPGLIVVGSAGNPLTALVRVCRTYPLLDAVSATLVSNEPRESQPAALASNPSHHDHAASVSAFTSHIRADHMARRLGLAIAAWAPNDQLS